MSARNSTPTGADSCPGQMGFDEVVDMELIDGDPEYAVWLAAGRPKVSWDEYDALRSNRARRVQIDTLPGL